MNDNNFVHNKYLVNKFRFAKEQLNKHLLKQF